MISIPKASKHATVAIAFLKWMMTDEPQIEVYAKGNFLQSRTDSVNNKYFKNNPKLIKATNCLSICTSFRNHWFGLEQTRPSGFGE